MFMMPTIAIFSKCATAKNDDISEATIELVLVLLAVLLLVVVLAAVLEIALFTPLPPGVFLICLSMLP